MDRSTEELRRRRPGASARLALSLALAAGVSTGVACGDDDDGKDQPWPGDAGGDAGDAGRGDASVDAGGSIDGGDAGGGNIDGGFNDGGDIDASDTGAPDAGDGGSENSPLAQLHSGVVVGVDDLRGLAYSTSGKLYASGYVTVAGDREIALVRFNADGSLDDTFGVAGVTRRNVIAAAADNAAENKGQESSSGVVELANGDLIVQGVANDGNGGQDVVLLKFDNMGAFNETFGVTKVDFGWSDAENASWPETAMGAPVDNSWGIALDNHQAASPKVVVFGDGPAPAGSLAEGVQRTDRDRYIARVLASDGTPDTTFATDGVFTLDVDSANLNDNARRGMVAANGAVVSAGYTNFGEGQGNHVVLIRLLPNGMPDPAFGFGTESTGATKFNPYMASGGMAEAYSVAPQSTGRLVTTGYGVSNTPLVTVENDLVSFGVVPGMLDPAYGTAGSVSVQSEGDPNAGMGARPNRENGRDVVTLADDSTVHVGVYDDFAALFVLTPNGAPDPSFGTNGRLVYGQHGQPFFKVTQSPDGSRVAAVTQGGEDGVLLAILGVNAN